jgi:hypothetical protein
VPVKLTLCGQVLNANGVILDPQRDASEIVTGFSLYLRRFPSLAKYYNVRVNAEGGFDAEDMRLAAAEKAVIICVELS